jgi:hypothetical protein
MALLTSLNEGAPGQDYFMLNGGTPSAPVIAGNPVQLCTGGPIASSSGTANAVNAITAAGTNSATAVLRLGTTAVPQALVLGPGVPVAGITNGTLNARVTMPANASITAAAFGQFVCQSGGQVYLESGGEIDVQPGAQVKFNNASAQRGTFRADVPVVDIPDTATQVISNPGSIVEGLYAVCVDCAGTTTNPNLRGVSTVAYWTGTAWEGGCVSAANNLELQAAPGKAQLQIVNGTGGTLDAVNVLFVLLAGAA